MALTPIQLLALLGIVAFSMGLSWWRHLKLERDLLEGTVRTFLQLFVVGFVLQGVFQANRWYYTSVILVLMTVIAGHNASRRGAGVPRIFMWSTMSIAAGALVTIVLVLGLGIIAPVPRYIIPVGGMIVGNSMIACGLVLNRYRADLTAKRDRWKVTYHSELLLNSRFKKC